MSDGCVMVPSSPAPQQLLLPGGISLESLNLIAQVQPALTPLVPLFEIIDAVVAALNCVKAIPDALGPLPDPTVLAACVPALAERVNTLLRLVRQLSLPCTIVGFLNLVLGTLREARTQLLHLQAQARQLAGVVDRAAALDDAGLAAIAACAQANIDQEVANVGARLASLGELLGLLNLFLGMVGGPAIPDLSSAAAGSLDGAVDAIDGLVQTLQAARSAVPVP